MARPRKQIDPDQVRELAAIQCSHAEMAAVLKCSPDTLQRRFAAVINEGRQAAFASLKRKQFEMAMGGNITMLIWLGKQYLGQRDKSELSTEHSGSIGVNIKEEELVKLRAQNQARIDAIKQRK